MAAAAPIEMKDRDKGKHGFQWWSKVHGEVVL